MTIDVAIVEDEFAIAQDISAFLTDHGYRVMGIYESGEDAFKELSAHPPDLLLVDIRLAGAMTGIALVERIKEMYEIPVIYITANSDRETYMKAKATLPNAFLVKPFTHSNLLVAVDLSLFNFSRRHVPEGISRNESIDSSYETLIHKNLFVRANGKHEKISSEEILFVKASGSYVHIQTSRNNYVLSQNLNSFLIKINLRELVRIHRSYAVNISNVESFDDTSLVISGHQLPISESYRQEFLSRIQLL
ncbi:MAG: response regulator [Cyclobacteriaceae bacterium]